MQVIWKYPLEIATDVRLQMPAGARLLTVQIQNETPCLWAVVDPRAEKELRVFSWYGTGHEHSSIPCTHIGTVQLGALVFHLFEN